MKKITRTEWPIEKKTAVITLRTEGYSVRMIAKKLNIPKSTVHKVIKKFESQGNCDVSKRSGRPKCTTAAEDKLIVLISKRDRRKTSHDILKEFNNTRKEKKICRTTVRKRLKDAGLLGHVAIRKPLLRRNNKKKRLAWAKAHVDWSIEQWRQVLFTDESKFEIFNNKRRVYVRRSTNEKMMPNCIVNTVKHGGGSVLVWGCFGNCQVGDLFRINGILNKEGYKEILEKHAIPSGKKIIGNGFIMQQDNDPKHTSLLCKSYLIQEERKKKLKNMIWPPQSPDCNPIELLWDELDRAVRTKVHSNLNQLYSNLLECWKNISKEKLENLTARMPRICKAVLKARGGYFDEKYV